MKNLAEFAGKSHPLSRTLADPDTPHWLKTRANAGFRDCSGRTIELAKHFEGFERKVKRGAEITAIAYVCPAGFWTIGYGHLCDPKHSPITEAEAEVYLARDLQSALAATLRFCPVLATEPESRLAAIVDFTFNLGVGRLQTSTLRRRVNQRDWAAAARELRRWVYGGGKVLPGLVTRRETEAAWLLLNV